MVLKKNESGFTLLSNMLAIVIIGLILPLLAGLYQAAADMPSYTEEISIQQFFQFLRDDLTKTVSCQVKDNKLVMTLSNDKQGLSIMIHLSADKWMAKVMKYIYGILKVCRLIRYHMG